ncbi:hypothetical protein Rsub_02791 [Raphidocelis subcapitata]|uniref:Legumain prodomain domain-containing protein n=1 Tax=Raphidocelis subcapitata TaxID=307507 RepID=A0A2V0NWZ2_9CHLO|nr:hypothetical protein Rsub_02791 [Raphidocelis subcapitata]|eukprot:GBF90083.1 hypothetical protein Rsub_02791 [Raphidocelis subcapitata]
MGHPRGALLALECAVALALVLAGTGALAARPEAREHAIKPLKEGESVLGSPARSAPAPSQLQQQQRAAPGPEPEPPGWLARLARAARAAADALRALAGGGGAVGKKHRRRAVDFPDGDDPGVRAHWAVLVAGSNGWGNYRHQADVYHAYHVLRAGGLLPSRIITLAYDDVASHDMNPARGRVFNRPGGPDVYGGVAIDYRGPDVTADTLLAVLRGDARGVGGRGTGRVLEAGPHDKVFLFYSHSPAPSRRCAISRRPSYIEACESGSMFEGLLDDALPIYATTAANAVESSWATYCPSFALDGAPADQDGAANGGAAGGWGGAGGAGPSGGPGPGPIPPPPSPEMTTCLGDLYSVAWMEDAESSDLTAETLEAQFHRLRLRTSNNFSYVQGSHVMRYGDLGMDGEVAGDYEGMLHNSSQPAPAPSAAADGAPALSFSGLGHARAPAQFAAAGESGEAIAANGGGGKGHGHRARHSPQRDADLLPLVHGAARAAGPLQRAAAAAALSSEVARRRAVDAAARGAAAALLADARAGPALLALLPGAPRLPAAAWEAAGGGGGGGAGVRPGGAAQRLQRQEEEEGPAAARRRLQALLGASAEAHAEALVGGAAAAGRRAGAAVVDDWGCLRAMVAAWEGACGQMDQYAMRHTRLLANLCNGGARAGELGAALEGAGACRGGALLLA